MYLRSSRFVLCYLYNWAKFGTIYSKMGDHGKLQNLKNFSSVPRNLVNCAVEFVKPGKSVGRTCDDVDHKVVQFIPEMKARTFEHVVAL